MSCLAESRDILVYRPILDLRFMVLVNSTRRQRLLFSADSVERPQDENAALPDCPQWPPPAQARVTAFGELKELVVQGAF
jgi:hypothetical protein